MATGGPPAPKKKTCKRCTDLPWSVTRPHAGCIAHTERLAKKVMSERASGTYVQYNGALNIWECSACVDAARVIVRFEDETEFNIGQKKELYKYQDIAKGAGYTASEAVRLRRKIEELYPGEEYVAGQQLMV